MVLAASNRVLASDSVAPQVERQLNAMDEVVSVQRLASVFRGDSRLTEAGVEDIQILELVLRPGGQERTIFDIVRGLREQNREVDPARISVDHVLVPDMHGDSCPSGPPMPAPVQQRFPLPQDIHLPPGGGHGSVTVIDAGFIKWAGDPLNALANVTYHAGPLVINGNWADSNDDGPDENGDALLDALAGHGNFVAGLFALWARQAPAIDLWNHNSGFEESFVQNGYLDVPLESAVCQSLQSSQSATAPGRVPDVIYLGFSFAPDQGIVPQVWFDTLKLITQSKGDRQPLLFAPVGNQSRSDRRYPAALGRAYPGQYDWVIGVGSVKPAPPHDVSDFSNFGDWVTCSAIGEGVVSTFIDPGRSYVPEEDATGTARAFHGWAEWNGTSFAAPKLAAVAADWINRVPAKSPLENWSDMKAGHQQTGDRGVIFPF
jgi:hypothetical protein